MIATKEQLSFTLNFFIEQRRARLLKELSSVLDADNVSFNIRHETIHKEFSAMNLYSDLYFRINPKEKVKWLNF